MRQAKSEHRLRRMLRCSAVAVISVQIVHSANAAGAPGAGGDGGNIPTQITLSFPQLTVIGGDWEIAKVRLSQAAPPGGATIKVTNVTANTTPDITIAPLTAASLSVPAGQTEASFKVITRAIPVKQVETISATYGSASAEVKLTVLPNGIASFSLQPSVVNWGVPAQGNITLQHAAPQDVNYFKDVAQKGAPAQFVDQLRKGGATVALKSSSGSVKVPASVNVPSGASGAQFPASTSLPSSCSMGAAGSTASTAVTVTATWQNTAVGNLSIGGSTDTASRYTSKTIGIDPKNILGVSHDAHALVLNGGDKCVQSVAAGDVLFFKHLGVLNVKKVMRLSTGQMS